MSKQWKKLRWKKYLIRIKTEKRWNERGKNRKDKNKIKICIVWMDKKKKNLLMEINILYQNREWLSVCDGK